MDLNWLDILNKVFEVALIPILGAATMYLVTLIKAKKQEILEKTKNETVKKYILMLESTITECVLATNQTYVETLKKEGKFDIEAQKKAFSQTYEAVVATLTAEAQITLQEAIQDINTYIANKIEATVANFK